MAFGLGKVFSEVYISQIWSNPICFSFLYLLLLYAFTLRGIVVKKKVTRNIKQARSNSIDGTVQKFLVTVLFLFSFFFFLQQNQTCSQSRQPKISRHFVFSLFFCFFVFFSFYIFGKLDRFQSGQSKISRHYFFFSFFHLTYTLISRTIVQKSDKKY